MDRIAAAVILALACGGCSGRQSALQPDGPQSATLFWLLRCFGVVGTVVWLAVMLMLLAALRRRHRGGSPMQRDAARERRSTVAVGSAVAATVPVIAALTVVSYAATRGMSRAGGDPLVIKVRGTMWWWEVRYPGPTPDQDVVTANEIHIPTGRPVRIELAASDVIHSFWVPNLAGKQDLVPGRDNALMLVADRAGTYRGQCSQFCGLQHAHMALLVVAETPPAFAAWREAQLRDAAVAADAEQARGRDVFTGAACANCHTVRGTAAAGTLGPDLTHVGGRLTIAAGLLPTTRGSLAAWISDPQTIKPGNNMPIVPLTAEQLRAVSAWLAGLR